MNDIPPARQRINNVIRLKINIQVSQYKTFVAKKGQVKNDMHTPDRVAGVNPHIASSRQTVFRLPYKSLNILSNALLC